MAHGLIPLLRAFAWLRWRLLANYLKSGFKRDLLGRFARWADVATLAFGIVFLLPIFLGLMALAVIFGWLLGTGEIEPRTVTWVFRLGLLVHVVGVLVLPVVLGGRPVLPSPARLLLLPIERRHIHLVSWISSLSDPWLLAGAILLLLLPPSILIAGRPDMAAVALVAGMLFLLALSALSSWLTSMIQRLFRDRRRRDTFTLVFFVVALALYLGLIALGEDEASWPIFEVLIYLNVIAELYLLALMPSGGAPQAVLALAGLAICAWGFFRLSARAHRRLLTDPDVGSGPREETLDPTGVRKIPGLSRAASAVAVVQARSLLRTVTGKMACLQGVLVVLITGLLLRDQLEPAWKTLAAPSILLLFVAIGFTQLSMLQLLFNQLAIDRAGLTLQFLLPLSPLDLLYGKAVGLGLLVGVSFSLGAVPAFFLAGSSWSGALWSLAAALLSLAAVHLSLVPLAAALSALLPRAVDFSQTFGKNQAHSLAVLIGMSATSLALGVPAALIALGMLLLEDLPLTLVLLLLWLALVLVLARLILPWVAKLVWHRREEVLHAAGGN